MNGTGYGMGTGLGTIRNLHKLQIWNRPGNAQWQLPSLVSTLQELLISLPGAASSFPTFSALSHYKCIAQPISTYKCFIQDELPLMLSYYRIAFEFCGSKFHFYELWVIREIILTSSYLSYYSIMIKFTGLNFLEFHELWVFFWWYYFDCEIVRLF